MQRLRYQTALGIRLGNRCRFRPSTSGAQAHQAGYVWVVSCDYLDIDFTIGRDFKVYDAETIDKFLSNIDQHVDHGLPSCHGPFSAFMTTRDESHQAITPTTSRGLTSRAAVAVEAHSSRFIGSPQPADPVLHEEELQKDDSELALNSAICLPSNLATSPSSSGPTDIDVLFDINAIEDSSSNEYEIEASLVAGHDAVGIGEENAPSLETSPVSYRGNNIIVRQLDDVLSGSRQQDYLIKHYYIHVAAVLLPLNHSDNPFRSLYLSTAMEGLFRHNSHTTTSREIACTALYQSLLASAAYHRWQCNKQDSIYHELGAKYRTNSIQLLQLALTQTPPTANYQALMLAVLSLVTIGVSHGCSFDSWSLLT
jgi:arginine metabolism regulation protein II